MYDLRAVGTFDAQGVPYVVEDPRVSDGIARRVLGLLFECSTEVVLVVDRVTRCVLAANAPAAELLVYEPAELVGATWAALAYEPDREIHGPGHYEDFALRRSDEYPVYVDLDVIHVDDPEHGALAAYIARDTTEKRRLQSELLAKHAALITAYADLDRAHRELEERNRAIASLSFRATVGEIVAGVAHHLNNPVAALTSTVGRLGRVVRTVDAAQRADLDKLLDRITRITSRIESNVAAIVTASRDISGPDAAHRPPPELAEHLSSFATQLDEIPTKETP